MRIKDKLYHNPELFKFALANNYYIPNQHMMAPVSLDDLIRDYDKFNLIPPWCPKPSAYKVALAAFERIYHQSLSASALMTFEEAISRMDTSTSCGWYYKEKGCKTKGEALIKYYDEIKTKVQQVFDGTSTHIPYAESGPKVEIRTTSKLNNPDQRKNAQRTFVVPDFIYSIVGIMLYHNYADHAQSTDKSTNTGKHYWNKAGYTPYYGGVTQFVASLTRTKKNKFLCLDISSQESAQCGQHISDLYEIYNSYLPLSTYFATRWYLKYTIHTPIIGPEHEVSIKNGSNVSGSSLTLLHNIQLQEIAALYHIARQSYQCDHCIECAPLPSVPPSLPVMIRIGGCYSCLVMSNCTHRTSELEDVALLANYASPSVIQNNYHALPAGMMGDDSIFADDPIWDGVEDSYFQLGNITTNECGPPGTLVPLDEAKFMNADFVFNPHRMAFVAKPNIDKLFAAIFYHFKSNSWRLCYARLCAMRILVYPFKIYFDQINSYIDYVIKYHTHSMRSETNMEDKIPYAALDSLILNRDQLEFLFYADEKSIKIESISGAHNNIPEIISTLLGGFEISYLHTTLSQLYFSSLRILNRL